MPTVKYGGRADYAVVGLQCDHLYEVVPDINGCRRSYSGPQNLPQETVWFELPRNTTPSSEPFAVMQLVYVDPQYIATFNQIHASLQYTPPANSTWIPAAVQATTVLPTPHTDGKGDESRDSYIIL